jgi:hypothetical protein
VDVNVFIDNLINNPVGFEKDFAEFQHADPLQFWRVVSSQREYFELVIVFSRLSKSLTAFSWEPCRATYR